MASKNVDRPLGSTIVPYRTVTKYNGKPKRHTGETSWQHMDIMKPIHLHRRLRIIDGGDGLIVPLHRVGIDGHIELFTSNTLVQA
jgi:hypothetical protein